MFAKINHVAITSDYYAVNGKFYEAVFGLKPSRTPRPARAVVLGDGYVGLNIIPRREGRCSGMDHFGLEVEDIDLAVDRMKKFDPSLEALKRPPVRPFAAYSAYDPDTNIFDLSQKSLGMQKDVYAENDGSEQPRRISHIAVRTRHAELCAQFYHEVFELNLLNTPDDSYHLSDGKVTLMIIPWKMSDYSDTDPQRLGPDHIEFEVESIKALEDDLEDVLGQNPHLHPRPLGHGTDGKARYNVFKKSAVGSYHLTDIEGVMIACSERQA